MSKNESHYIPFSQRTGLAPIPPQLNLGEVSDEFRRLLFYVISLEIDRHTLFSYNGSYFDAKWRRVAKDMHVRYFRLSIDLFENAPHNHREKIKRYIEQVKLGPLFDFTEFIMRHTGCSAEMKQEITQVFVDARTAYRIFDNSYIAAIGTEEQAEAFERAIADAAAKSAQAARKQLIAAGVALRDGAWASCVRESINAVEAVAAKFGTGADSLGKALTALEKKGHLHGSLKAAFAKLYGSSRDEKGVRHALVFTDEPQVDETDALFMLGACAAFVSYLLARSE